VKNCGVISARVFVFVCVCVCVCVLYVCMRVLHSPVRDASCMHTRKVSEQNTGKTPCDECVCECVCACMCCYEFVCECVCACMRCTCVLCGPVCDTSCIHKRKDSEQDAKNLWCDGWFVSYAYYVCVYVCMYICL